MLEEVQRSVDEVAWRYLAAASAAGIHAQAAPTGGHGVFDEEASWRLHERRHREGGAARKMQEIDATIAQCEPEHARRIRVAFEPYGRVSWALSQALGIPANISSSVTCRVSLTGLALESRSLRVAYEQSPGARVHTVLQWLEPESRRGSGALVANIMRDTIEMLSPALAEYERYRRARIESLAAARAERERACAEAARQAIESNASRASAQRAARLRAIGLHHETLAKLREHLGLPTEALK